MWIEKGCNGGELGGAAKVIIERYLAVTERVTHTKILAALAAILDERRTWLSKGTFLLPGPTHTTKFGSTAARVCEIIERNKNQTWRP